MEWDLNKVCRPLKVGLKQGNMEMEVKQQAGLLLHELVRLVRYAFL